MQRPLWWWSSALSPCPPQGRGSAQLQGLGISEGLLRPAQCPGEAGDTARVTELQPEGAVLCAFCSSCLQSRVQCCRKGQAAPSAQGHLHSPWTEHETGFALSPQRAPQAASLLLCRSTELRFSHFMQWESTEIQVFHRVRKTWQGKVTFPSSKHHPALLDLRNDTGQRFLLPAGLAHGHGDTSVPTQHRFGVRLAAPGPGAGSLPADTQASLSYPCLSRQCHPSFWAAPEQQGLSRAVSVPSSLFPALL